MVLGSQHWLEREKGAHVEDSAVGRSGRQGPLAVHNLFCRLRLDRTQPGVVDASPGQRIQLTCHAEGFPVPTIEWQRDGQLVSSPRFIQAPTPHSMETRAGLGPGETGLEERMSGHFQRMVDRPAKG